VSIRVADGTPQGDGFNFDPLTHFTRIFCKFLQKVFSGFEKGNYHWSEDEKLTDIVISDQATVAKETVERRPAILVARGPANFSNLSLNQLAGPLVGYSDINTVSQVKPNIDPQAGTERHTDLIAGTMIYNCLSREGLEAQRLAWACGYFTRALKAALLRAGLHRVGEDVGFGGESPPGSLVTPDTNEIVLVTVSVPFFFQETHTIGPKYKTLLNEVSLALTSQLSSTTDTESPQLKPPSIYGQVLQGVTLVPLGSRVNVGPGTAPYPRRPKS
jgi:hypothetical protein